MMNAFRKGVPISTIWKKTRIIKKLIIPTALQIAAFLSKNSWECSHQSNLIQGGGAQTVQIVR